MMLSLQDVGREVARSANLETLIPTIISTARSALRCRSCSIYFPDENQLNYRNALTPRDRDMDLYVPKWHEGIGRWVRENGRVFTVDQPSQETEISEACKKENRIPAGIAPLMVGNEFLGLLIIENLEQSTNNLQRLLHIIANISSLAIKNALLFERIELSAKKDGLTDLLNKNSFFAEFEHEAISASRSRKPFTVILADIDHFKKFNDTYGHVTGDVLLKEFSRIWREVLGAEAISARFGGEEFIALVPNCDLAQGEEIAEDLRSTVADHMLLHENVLLQVTASFGLTTVDPNQHEGELSSLNPDHVVAQADKALYKAKRDGRNRVTNGGYFKLSREYQQLNETLSAQQLLANGGANGHHV
ncbi:sensor domain-containing diguanylate cyclase [Calycomorphotria hydatis]|nr:sensor domain-containing diguanylate cyclase [Calycomorphotria hydatis]